jgi:hypothetical protein
VLKWKRLLVLWAIVPTVLLGSVGKTQATAAGANDFESSYLVSQKLPAGVTAKRPRVFLLGDSTLAALRWYASSEATLDGLDYELDAESCRTISVVSCKGRTDPITGERTTPDNALTVMESYPAGQFDELVLMIGYDESLETFTKSVPLLLDLAKRKGYKHVTWLTFRVDTNYTPPRGADASYRSNNAILDATVAQANGYVSLLDWNRYSNDNDGLLEEDGVHLTTEGAYAVGDFIHGALDWLWNTGPSSLPVELAHSQQNVAPGGYVLQREPTRLLDTRTTDGQVAGGEAVRVQLPNGKGLAAASINLTATETTGSGYLTAYSCAAVVPPVSSLNFARREVRAAATIVSLDADGGFCVYSSVRTHVLVDLVGVIDASSAAVVVPQAPARVFDTRSTKRLAANQDVRVPLSLAGAVGASMIVTAVDASADGWLAVTPTRADGTCGVPTTSNLNFTTKAAVANSVGVSLDLKAASVCVHTSAPTHVLLDVMATVRTPTGSAATTATVADRRWAPSPPTRLIDTRVSLGKRTTLSVPLTPGVRTVTVTAAEPTVAGYVTAYPAGAAGVCGSPPNSSIVNTRPGNAVANMTFVDATPGVLCLFASTPTHLIVDAL